MGCWLKYFWDGFKCYYFYGYSCKSLCLRLELYIYKCGYFNGCTSNYILFIPFFRKLNSTTAYEYLEVRFNYAIRVFSSLSFILFQIGRMGVVLYLPAIALNIATGMDIMLCISLMGILSLIYTMMGG